MKFNKSILYVISVISLIISMSSIAYADSSVNATADNISVKKSAEWTTYNNSSTDSSGNPYVKINFEIDTTNAANEIVDKIKAGGDTDIILVLDISSSMKGTKIEQAKKAAVDFTTKLKSINTYKVKVGVVQFAKDAELVQGLTENKDEAIQKINNMQNKTGTNIQHGIVLAGRALQQSTAKNKVIILLSDGRANTKYKEEGAADVVHDSSKNAAELTELQVSKYKQLITDLDVVTIGYQTDANTDAFLKNMATKTSSGKEMFYKSDVESSEVLQDLSTVFETISQTVTTSITGLSLTDTIPKEFSIIDSTAQCSDTALTFSTSADKKTIMWSWGNNKLDKKVYKMSILTILDKTQVTEEILNKKNNEINTNGTTIDPTVDSLGSSVFTYGDNKTIKLVSPTLNMTTRNEVEVKTEPNNSEKKDSTPETGDYIHYILNLISIVGIIATASVITILKRRRAF